MYFISVVLLLLVFPAGSVVIDLIWGGSADIMASVGKCTLRRLLALIFPADIGSAVIFIP